MDVLRHIAERRIQRAIDDGEFDDLPGKGKPLPRDELAHVPPAQRMAVRILRNAGAVPPEVEMRREIYRLDKLIAAGADPEDLAELRRRRAAAQLSFELALERRRLRG